MRIASAGNLTVDIIRAHRFDPALARPDSAHLDDVSRTPCHVERQPDQVELSPEALAHDPRGTDPTSHDPSARSAIAIDQVPPIAQAECEADGEPDELSPVVGSVALSGLGVAVLVPGTLLDVVA
ncbi:MAG: hypothetical protein ACPGYV_10810 [Phycisphaeraceae bacterium]